jgi:HlyD family secretion protein
MNMRRIGKVLLVLALVVTVTVSAYVHFRGNGTPAQALTLYGNVDIRQIQMAFQDTGRIRRLAVEEGDRVDKGQLIAEMDPARYEAAVSRSRSRMVAQKELVEKLLAGSRPEEIAEARAKVRAAEAISRDAEQTYRRLKGLAAGQYVSQEKLDQAEAAYKAAVADLDALHQALALAVKGPRKEDIAGAQAQLKADEAALALAEMELADTRLYAPARGVIQDRILEPGAMAFPQTPVFVIALTEPVWVRAYVPEPDLGKISLGMKAEITTDSFPGKVYAGWVGYISPTAEFTPKQVETTEMRSKLVYQARIYACNPEDELRLGMPAIVTIPLDQPRTADGANGANACAPGPDSSNGR